MIPPGRWRTMVITDTWKDWRKSCDGRKKGDKKGAESHRADE
jgi:hypothetical protein